MMENKEEQLKETVIWIADYVIATGASTRKTAAYLKEQGFSISHVTVHFYLTKRLPEFDFGRYVRVKEILGKNTPKTVRDVEVKKRVYQATSLLLQGLTIPQIVEEMNTVSGEEKVSIDIIYDDLTKRLPKIETDPQILADVKKELLKHRLQNLNQGTNAPLTQPRNQLLSPPEAKKRA